jgi:hypothetical protein
MSPIVFAKKRDETTTTKIVAIRKIVGCDRWKPQHDKNAEAPVNGNEAKSKCPHPHISIGATSKGGIAADHLPRKGASLRRRSVFERRTGH